MTIQLTTASRALAMLRSRAAIKDSLRAHGLKLTEYSAREITSWAALYLDDHAAELMPDAIAEARRMIENGVLGKKAARALAQAHCANLRSDAQTQSEPKSNTSAVQMSGAK
jgi:hypothetical protein